MREPTYVSIKADNTIKASIFRSGIGSRANTYVHQESNTVAASIFGSGIDTRPIYVRINITRLVNLVGWDTA